VLDDALKKIPPAMIYDQPEPDSASSRRIIVLTAEPHEIASLKRSLPKDLLIEPEILHKLHASPARSPMVRQSSTRVTVRGGGAPLPAARITIYFEAGGSLNTLPLAFTGSNGRAELSYDSSIQPLFVIAEPDGGFWALFNQRPTSHVHFDCPSLPKVTPLEWWHRAVGVHEYDERRGEGIRIGVIGTGVGPHPRLRHVILTDGKTDIERHETHVCGIIAARPKGKGEFAGIAPGASVFSARIFHKGPDGPVAENHGVIAQTSERMARAGKKNGFAADLINLSFGSPEASQILRDAIQWALEEGTLCISSAGNNTGGPLDYPAAFPETIAVTALGKIRWGPKGSTGKHWIPQKKDKFGARDFYLAAMSSIGSEVNCIAPGNGIISTIPRTRRQKGHAAGRIPAPYAAMDGTSLASPMACGVLAALLSEMPAYRALPRNATRSRMARKVLQKHSTSIGLKPEYQGKGLPSIPTA